MYVFRRAILASSVLEPADLPDCLVEDCELVYASLPNDRGWWLRGRVCVGPLAAMAPYQVGRHLPGLRLYQKPLHTELILLHVEFVNLGSIVGTDTHTVLYHWEMRPAQVIDLHQILQRKDLP